jgi:membrane protease YdiL (CAAX protease family)
MTSNSTLDVPTAPGRRFTARALAQYSRRQVLGIWAAAALPMGVLSWGAAPGMARILDGPTAWPRAIVMALTAGLVWQAVLVAVLLRRETGSLRWSVFRPALWLWAPRSPRSGRIGGRVWWVLLPITVALVAKEMPPALPSPDERDLGTFLASTVGQEWLSGNWTWFAVITTMWIFNTVLGEELLFRGLLLPRMNGAFGRWDWVANGLLFGAYHLHAPWGIYKSALGGTFVLAYPVKRYGSAVLGILVHSVQSVVFTGILLALVLA